MKIIKLVFFGIILSASAARAADWSQTNIQFLHSNDYRTVNGSYLSQTVVTFEHLSGWKYGSNFFFFDLGSPDTENSNVYYGEFSPAFSFSKMGLIPKFENSVFKDAALQFNFELAQAPARRVNLVGLTFEWNIPYIDYLATQFLYRDALGVSGSTGQFTVVWLVRFEPFTMPMEFSGFIDWAGKEETLSDNLHTQASLLFDFARTDLKAPFKVGLEYKYWNNKYGIQGLVESAPQAKLVWIF